MMLGSVTYNVLKDWDLETVITKLEQAGFEAVELRTSHKHGVEPSISAEERAKVRAALDDDDEGPAFDGDTSEGPLPKG